MTDPMMDQANAASRVIQTRLAAALGIDPEELKPRGGKSLLFDKIFDVVKDNPGCQHLKARPIQPSYLVMHVGMWSCAECTEPFARAWAGKLGKFEEFTCDLCRRYSPATLRPFTLATGIWVIMGSACQRCGDQHHFAELGS